MADSKLATFKIDPELWEEFKGKAGNASEVLKAFVEQYVAGNIGLDLNSGTITQQELDERIEAVLNKRLADIEERLGKLNAV